MSSCFLLVFDYKYLFSLYVAVVRYMYVSTCTSAAAPRAKYLLTLIKCLQYLNRTASVVQTINQTAATRIAPVFD
jgi:hypothetical protein